MPSCMSKTCKLVMYLLLLSACLGIKALRHSMPSWDEIHALGESPQEEPRFQHVCYK